FVQAAAEARRGTEVGAIPVIDGAVLEFGRVWIGLALPIPVILPRLRRRAAATQVERAFTMVQAAFARGQQGIKQRAGQQRAGIVGHVEVTVRLSTMRARPEAGRSGIVTDIG